ncbi:GNAT family N-acetyltransferase [Nonomuraea purpurea]|uniref:GNAT family N-acetyltransferase n=1 Tax=Nonomuraea purpurea TaxID=1849276 RepID=A0ABV8GF40_9ACTN
MDFTYYFQKAAHQRRMERAGPVDVVKPGELTGEATSAWRLMQRAQPHLDNPFLSPEFTIAAGDVRRDVRVAVLQDDRGFAAFFPFERRKGGIGSGVASWVSLCQGVVHRPDVGIDARVLLEGAGLHVWNFGCLAAQQPWLASCAQSRMETAVLNLADGFPAYLTALRERSPKFLRSTLYKERKLGRDLGTVSFDLDTADEAQFRLLRRWKSQQYLAKGRADRFSRAWVVELVERLHAMNTPDFAGHLSMLYADGRPVAGHFGIRTATTLAGWFPAYDPDAARYSPGLIQHLRMAEAAASAGIRAIDLSVKADSEYKDALSNDSGTVAEGVVRRPTATAVVHRWSTQPVHRLRRLVLDTPALYRRADQVMRWRGRWRSTS